MPFFGEASGRIMWDLTNTSAPFAEQGPVLFGRRIVGENSPTGQNADGTPGRLGVLDYGAVARLPQEGLPEPLGILLRLCVDGDAEAVAAGLRELGFIKEQTKLAPELLQAYLGPLVEPSRGETFRFSREWMREQFRRLNDPKSPEYTVSIKINLPPSYMLLHRTWVGGIAVLSQIGAEIRFRAMLEEFVPGFSE
jgi:hypothetical protein